LTKLYTGGPCSSATLALHHRYDSINYSVSEMKIYRE